MTLIAKPFITICGDEYWCEQIEKSCIPNLPMEPTEWVRKTGSDFKLVHVDIDARRFDSEHLKDFGNTILDSPLFHLFVIVENEDKYTKTTKNIFSHWIGTLRSRSLDTWTLFVVSDDIQNKKFSFNRFSISNKIKSDFNIQKLDCHLIKITENPKERFTQIQTILRDIILNIYDDRCFKNEDKIRIQRETRFTPQWNYFDYFSLQEELADVYECLSLYEESLAQFDETNFIFGKCLDGYYKGESSCWINHLKNVPFEVIDCLILTNYSDPQKRCDLSQGKLCLADFRAYLLSRQCALLQLLNKYQEIPALVYTVLISFLNECKLLNLDIDSSIKNSWIFLTSLQALQRFSPIDCVNSVAQDYATLFLLALNSISKLANDWDIWSHKSIDWSEIEKLVKKLSVLNHDEFGDTPSSRLANGLRSQEYFQEFHKKLFEEALVILKHIGRIRSANNLGVQLADLYCQIDNYEEAEPFYLKAIKYLHNENWTHLAMPLRLKLARCQKDQFYRDPEKYLKTCVHLAGATFSTNDSYSQSSLSLKNEAHDVYYNELMTYVGKYYDKFETPRNFRLEPLFSIKSVKLLLPIDGYQTVQLVIISHLPQIIELKLFLFGRKFEELDLTYSKSSCSGHLNENFYIEENNEFPAQFPISLSNQSSPKLHKSNELKNNLKKKNELYYQSSMEDNLQTLNAGISVQMNISNTEFAKNDRVLTLVCFPKTDEGIKTQKYSTSQDIAFIEDCLNNDIIDTNVTKFIPNEKTLIFKPGENLLILKSEELGLFLPENIVISIFNDKLYLKERIDEQKIDQNFYDVKTLETFLPDFLVGNNDNVAFVNFNNEIKPNVKIGLLSLPNNFYDVELCVKSEDCKEIHSIKRRIKHAASQPVILHGSEISLRKPLCYNLDSSNDKIYGRVPGLLKKRLQLLFFEEISILEKIIPTSSSRYIVKVDLLQYCRAIKPKVNYIIKNSSLRLHHGIDVCQVLPSVHKSLSLGNFNEQMQFTLLWFIESIDILNLEKECLRFTLSLDLMIQMKDQGLRSGSIRHEFELNHY